MIAYNKPRNLLTSMALAGAVMLAMTGCSATDNLIDNVVGTKNSDRPLPGKREKVLVNDFGDNKGSAIATAPVAIPSSKTNSSWTQPGGVASNVMNSLTLGRKLQKLFSIEAGKGSNSDGRLVASPIVVGGRVCVLDSRAKLRCFNANNGGQIWKTSLVPEGKDGKGAYGGGIASDGSRIYATTAFGEALALDASSGAIIWRQTIGSPIRTAPTVSNGKVFFVTIANESVALAASSGQIAWQTQGGESPAAMIASSSPAVSGSLVVMPSSTGDLNAYDANTGGYRWSQNMSQIGPTASRSNLNDIAGRPVIAGKQVIAIASAGRIASFSISGDEQWSRDLPGTQTPWVAGDYLFVIVNRKSLVAISLSTGRVRWIKDLPEGGVWAGPVMGDGRLLAVAESGRVTSVSPQTGQVMNSFTLGEKLYIAPVIANGTIYLRAEAGTLFAYR